MAVISFRDKTALPGEPDADIVERLEMLLAQAKAGEIKAIAYGAAKVGNQTMTGWVGMEGTWHEISTALMMLTHRWNESLIYGEGDDA